MSIVAYPITDNTTAQIKSNVSKVFNIINQWANIKLRGMQQFFQ